MMVVCALNVPNRNILSCNSMHNPHLLCLFSYVKVWEPLDSM